MSLGSSPKLIKGGLVVLDAAAGAVTRTIALQYNPDTLSRSYHVQGAGGDGGAERAQPFRLVYRLITINDGVSALSTKGRLLFLHRRAGRAGWIAADRKHRRIARCFRDVRRARPFTMEAVVILPDHLHCIWTLPKGDDDSTRWR